MKVNDVLLGLVALHPNISGYDLKKVIDDSTRYFIPIQLSQIYPSLKKMTEEGLLSYSEEITEGGRATKRYCLTKAGEEKLFSVLRNPITFTMSTSSSCEFILRTTFIGLLPKEDQIQFFSVALEHYRKERDTISKKQYEIVHLFLSKSIDQCDSVRNIWERQYEHILKYDDLVINWLEEVLASLED